MTNYFTAAKKAARNARKNGLCQTTQHRLAMEVVAKALPAACPTLVADLGWQAVLASL